MTDRPSAAARWWDAAALLLLAAGAALYVAAHAGMRGILARQVQLATIEAPNITRWVHYRTMSNIGLGLVVAGIGTGIAAYYRSRAPASRRAGGALAAASLPDALSPNAVPDSSPSDTPNAPQ